MCLTWIHCGEGQKLSAKSHVGKDAFIFSVVLQLLSTAVFVLAIRFLVFNALLLAAGGRANLKQQTSALPALLSSLLLATQGSPRVRFVWQSESPKQTLRTLADLGSFRQASAGNNQSLNAGVAPI